MGYEDDFLECLERIIRDLDRRITRGKERLRKSADAKQQVVPLLPYYCSSLRGGVVSVQQMCLALEYVFVFQVLSGDSGVTSEKLKRLNMDINAMVVEVGVCVVCSVECHSHTVVFVCSLSSWGQWGGWRRPRL